MTRVVDCVPSGYRQLGRQIRETEKAILFDYYGHELFIPKKQVVQYKDEFWCPYPAIDRAKAFNMDRSRS